LEHEDVAERVSDEGELRFAVDCRLLFELGEQLVARKSVALAELVKNGYDADATSVAVVLANVTQPDGKITITDNGSGMALETIRNAWMRVATDDKSRNPRSSRYSRPRAGAKGIGRFASRRLARQLVLRSVAARRDGNREETTVQFDWEKFIAGKGIEEIPNHYRSRTVEKGEPTGVTLSLIGLRETWGTEDVAELQRDLLGLVSPFPAPRLPQLPSVDGRTRDPGFTLHLEASEFPEYAGPISDRFLKSAWGRLTGRIDVDGRAHYRLKIRRAATSTFSSDRRFPHARGAQFRIHFFVYRSEFFKGLSFSVAEARKLASDQSGVRIYMDGFRVFPYGDPTDDWLRLDQDRARRLTTVDADLKEVASGVERPMLLIPGNNQLFGVVFLSRLTNSNVSLTASRERLLENEAFSEIQHFVRLGIDWMTVEYAKRLQQQRAKLRPDETDDPIYHLNLVRERVESAPELQQQTKAQVLQALTLATQGIEAQQQERIGELSMIRVLASVGTMVLIFDHELRATVDALRGIHTDLKAFKSRLAERTDRLAYETLLGRLDKWIQSVQQQGSQIVACTPKTAPK
jgi:hypothetical protein